MKKIELTDNEANDAIKFLLYRRDSTLSKQKNSESLEIKQKADEEIAEIENLLRKFGYYSSVTVSLKW